MNPPGRRDRHRANEPDDERPSDEEITALITRSQVLIDELRRTFAEIKDALRHEEESP